MAKVRLCLVMFVIFSFFPLQAYAIPFDAGAFTTLGIVWENMIQNHESPDLMVPTSFDFTMAVTTSEKIIYPAIVKINENTLSVALDFEQEMQTSAETSGIEKEYGSDDAGNMPVPEPSTFLLLGIGVAGLAWLRSSRAA